MELKLTLEQTGQTWTLKPNRNYTIGSSENCDIVLPYPTVEGHHLACSFDLSKQTWQLQDLNSVHGTFVDNQRVSHYLASRQTRITLSKNFVIIATPVGSSPVLSEYLATSATSARLISGTAYRLGLRGSLFLLNSLRADPYKAKSPETSLNLEEIATHASQSIALSLVCVGAALTVVILQVLLLWSSLGFSEGLGAWVFSFFFANWFTNPVGFGFDPTMGVSLRFFDAIAALIIAYELVYMRWSVARRFLKNRYRPNFRIGFLQDLTTFLKRRILQAEPSQNTIVFGGFSPFLGAGTPIASSDITIAIYRKLSDNLSKQADDSVNIPIGEFYQAIDDEVSKLKLPNLQVLSHLYVKGFELNSDGNILKSPLSKPTSVLPEEQVWFLGQSDLAAERRAYRVYRYVDTARDNVLSYFVRFYNIGSVTFVEGVACGLTSFDRKIFSLAPVLGEYLLCRVLKTLIMAILLAQFRLYLIPALWQLGIFLINAFLWWRSDLKQRRAARLQEEYDYGPARTFREAIAAPFDSSYYGNQDLIMYWRSIQQALFKGIVNVLEKYDADTSQFDKSVTSIVNHGVMVTGGQLNASQVAAGQGVKAIMNAAASAVGLQQPTTSQAKPSQSKSSIQT